MTTELGFDRVKECVSGDKGWIYLAAQTFCELFAVSSVLSGVITCKTLISHALHGADATLVSGVFLKMPSFICCDPRLGMHELQGDAGRS